MTNQKLHTNARVITLKRASLDNVEGFATAHVERLQGGKKVVVETFKGERTFHNARKGTSARMIYRGLAEDGGALFRVEVPVSVRIQVRGVKFKSTGAIVVWEKVEDA